MRHTGSATFARGNASTITNCYYTRTLGTVQGEAMSSITLPDGVTASAESGGTYSQGETIWYYPVKTVTLIVAPGAGYILDVLTVTNANDQPVTVQNGSFTMPAGNVTATYEMTWAILSNYLNNLPENG